MCNVGGKNDGSSSRGGALCGAKYIYMHTGTAAAVVAFNGADVANMMAGLESLVVMVHIREVPKHLTGGKGLRGGVSPGNNRNNVVLTVVSWWDVLRGWCIPYRDVM